MSFTHAQATVTNSTSTLGATTLGATLAGPPSVGDVVCVYVFVPATCSGVHDGNSNVYTVSPSSPSNVNISTAGVVYLFYWIATGTPSATVTATFPALGAGNVAEIFVDDFSVQGNVALFDQDAAGNGSAGTINTPSFTPKNSGELFYAGACVQNNVTVINPPWVGTISGVTGGAVEYILNNSVTQNPNMTITSGPWDSLMMAFTQAPIYMLARV